MLIGCWAGLRGSLSIGDAGCLENLDQESTLALGKICWARNQDGLQAILTLCPVVICSFRMLSLIVIISVSATDRRCIAIKLFARHLKRAWSDVFWWEDIRSGLKIQLGKHLACVRRARKFHVPSATFLAGVRSRRFAKYFACLSQVRNKCRVNGVQQKYAWKLP